MSFVKLGDFTLKILMIVRCIHSKQSTDITKIKIQELVQRPVEFNKYPKIIGPTNPPKPPINPTIPPTTPTSFGKYSGMCLKTAAFPIPYEIPIRITSTKYTHILASNLI
jgi:hypothetical protein